MRATNLWHKCNGFHAPLLDGNVGAYPSNFSHDCACGIGHDHTVAEYLAFDWARDEDDDD